MHDGKMLDKRKFIIAMHLQNVLRNGKITDLPAKLPRGIYKAAMPGRIVAGRMSLRSMTARDLANPASLSSSSRKSSASGYLDRPSKNAAPYVPLPMIEASSPLITFYRKAKHVDIAKTFNIHKNFLGFYSPVVKSWIEDNYYESMGLFVDSDVFGMLSSWMYSGKLQDRNGCDPFPKDLIYLYVLAYQLQIPDLCNQVVDLYIELACDPAHILAPNLQMTMAAGHAYGKLPKNSRLGQHLTCHFAGFHEGRESASIG